MICWDVDRLSGCKITRKTRWWRLEVLKVYCFWVIHIFVMYYVHEDAIKTCLLWFLREVLGWSFDIMINGVLRSNQPGIAWTCDRITIHIDSYYLPDRITIHHNIICLTESQFTYRFIILSAWQNHNSHTIRFIILSVWQNHNSHTIRFIILSAWQNHNSHTHIICLRNLSLLSYTNTLLYCCTFTIRGTTQLGDH